jgi:hypothetical protein
MIKPIYSTSQGIRSQYCSHRGPVPYDWIDDYDMTIVTFPAQYDYPKGDMTV